ncbi:MAG: imidazole glycerol phosphate synthase subunit HisH [Ginsengibacter sp.]
MISIIDYGAGNLGSIANMLRKLGNPGIITSSADDIAKADKLILPGVGNFDYGMSKLQQSGLIEVLNDKVLNDKIPVLGICLGAQLMTKKSEEGKLPGLGWFDAEVKKFSFPADQINLRIPHMGWNYVTVQKQTLLTKDLPEESKYYFVHSYYIHANTPEDVMLTTNYYNDFASALNHDNIYALQFHPEKSHKYGLKIFQNFLSI